MAKKKEMNRTSGTARRLTGRSEGIATKLKYGAPLTGSASGVKSISLKDAGEVLTQGIVTLGKKGLKVAPEGLAMALPVGKVAKAASALRAAGKLGKAAALESRVAAKTVGRMGKVATEDLYQYLSPSEAKAFAASGRARESLNAYGPASRKASESVFPRAPKNNLGDLEFLPGMTKTQAAQKMAYGTDLAKRPTFRTGGAGPRLPEAGSVDMVKKTAKQFGQKVSGKEANNISRLLRGRGR